MPWKERTRICQWCLTEFWCKSHRTWHCSRTCAQTHTRNAGPKPYKEPKVKEKIVWERYIKPRVTLYDESYQYWFWNQVDKTGECWIWKGKKDNRGYGVARRRNDTDKAYRQAWMLTNGEVPKTDRGGHCLSVRHKCRTKACVNPAHLELGTHAENMRDRWKWKRSLISDALGWNKDERVKNQIK